jgi:3-deoxy-manno-octulosonate cytidylyltransferase (CMP-KDO synthetase)
VKAVIVIPARYASTRLPAKPLLRETGKYLIQHVHEQARRCKRAGEVVVATDDGRIARAVQTFGGRCVLTRPDHPSGTDRVAEVARDLDAELIVNLQGDEPLIDPASLDLLIELLQAHPDTDMTTLATPLPSAEAWRDPNVVKVVCDDAGRALYFSRSPIPHVRDGEPDFAARPVRFLQHLGLYAYRKGFLLRLASLPPHPLEQLEKLEQLRALATGHILRVGVVAEAGLGVDTYDDYRRFVALYRQRQAGEAA